MCVPNRLPLGELGMVFNRARRIQLHGDRLSGRMQPLAFAEAPRTRGACQRIGLRSEIAAAVKNDDKGRPAGGGALRP